MPDQTWYLQIHERLLAGDPIAPAELAEEALDALVEELRMRYPRLKDADLPADAATDALMDYIKRPEQFDSEKRGLWGFLVMAAQRDLQNVLARSGRRNQKEISLNHVEVEAMAGNKETEEEKAGARIDAERMRGRIAELFEDPIDQKLVELVIENERSTRAFARALGIEDLSEAEQRKQVKQHKDRIKKRLQRYGERFRECE